MSEPNNLPEAQQIITLEFSLVPGEDTGAGWMNSLVQRVNYLIVHDFDKLVSTLYRLDVDEMKIKTIFKNTQLNAASDGNAGLLISTLIVERQLRKLETKEEYRTQKNSFNDDDRW